MENLDVNWKFSYTAYLSQYINSGKNIRNSKFSIYASLLCENYHHSKYTRFYYGKQRNTYGVWPYPNS